MPLKFCWYNQLSVLSLSCTGYTTNIFIEVGLALEFGILIVACFIVLAVFFEVLHIGLGVLCCPRTYASFSAVYILQLYQKYMICFLFLSVHLPFSVVFPVSGS